DQPDTNQRGERGKKKNEAKNLLAPGKAADPDSHGKRNNDIQHQIFGGVDEGCTKYFPEKRIARGQTDIISEANKSCCADDLPVGETKYQRRYQWADDENNQPEQTWQQKQCRGDEIAPAASAPPANCRDCGRSA